MREVTPPLPAGDQIDSPRLVLRDGTVASVRATDDVGPRGIRRFFRELSAESRRNRFFTSSEPPDTVIDRMSDSTDPEPRAHPHRASPSHRTTCVRSRSRRTWPSTRRLPRWPSRSTKASRGAALSTALLERLAVHATRHGFQRFQASTFADNNAMLEVFRDSGFEIRSKTNAGVVDLQLSLTMSPEGVRSSEERDRIATAASLAPMLAPSAVAVIGVSRTTAGIGRRVFDALRAGGFGGADLSGQPARRRDRRAPLLRLGARPAGGHRPRRPRGAGRRGARHGGRVRGRRRQVARGHLGGLRRGRRGGPGPAAGARRACPQSRHADGRAQLHGRPQRDGGRAPERVVLADHARGADACRCSSQSGALGIAIIELAIERQVGLSTFVSVGNKADVSGNDLLQYWERDPDTAVMLLYLESFGNPRRFARLARRIARSKPIVAVKAGRTTRWRPGSWQPHRRTRRERRRRECALPAVGRHPRRHDR